jgi:hypothetical protein
MESIVHARFPTAVLSRGRQITQRFDERPVGFEQVFFAQAPWGDPLQLLAIE